MGSISPYWGLEQLRRRTRVIYPCMEHSQEICIHLDPFLRPEYVQVYYGDSNSLLDGSLIAASHVTDSLESTTSDRFFSPFPWVTLVVTAGNTLLMTRAGKNNNEIVNQNGLHNKYCKCPFA